MRWDADAVPDELDEDEIQMFETLRKDLRGFVDAILGMDKDLVASAVQQLSLNTLKVIESGVEVPWQDAELAVFLVFIYGELTRCKSSLFFPQLRMVLIFVIQHRQQQEGELLPSSPRSRRTSARLSTTLSTHSPCKAS